LACKLDQAPVIEDHRLLLDSCSTDNVYNNLELLTNVRKCSEDEKLFIVENGGNMIFDAVGKIKVLTVESYYNKNSLTNIISLKKLVEVEGISIIGF
jgi:hypothetical protein